MPGLSSIHPPRGLLRDIQDARGAAEGPSWAALWPGMQAREGVVRSGTPLWPVVLAMSNVCCAGQRDSRQRTRTTIALAGLGGEG